MPLGFAKAHYQIPLEKSGCGPGLGELPEIRGFPFNTCTTAEASDFKFGTQLGFSKPHQKPYPAEKVGWSWAREIPKGGFPYNIYTMV